MVVRKSEDQRSAVAARTKRRAIVRSDFDLPIEKDHSITRVHHTNLVELERRYPSFCRSGCPSDLRHRACFLREHRRTRPCFFAVILDAWKQPRDGTIDTRRPALDRKSTRLNSSHRT